MTKLLITVVALTAVSCGRSSLVNATGTLHRGSEPAVGAVVTFVPADGINDASKPRASGVVGADGTYILRTHPAGSGVAPGDYVVVVTWVEGNAREGKSKSKLPDTYADPSRSPLRATVKPDSATLEPIVLP